MSKALDLIAIYISPSSHNNPSSIELLFPTLIRKTFFGHFSFNLHHNSNCLANSRDLNRLLIYFHNARKLSLDYSRSSPQFPNSLDYSVAR